MAPKSILGPVTMHICEPDNALSLRHSQAMNLSMNSDMPKPVAFFIQQLEAYHLHLFRQTNDMIEATITICLDIFLFVFIYIPYPKWLVM